MASTIKIKRSAVSGNAPNTSNITTGELALNTADGILYSSDGSSIFEIGANLSSLSVASITYPTSDGTLGQVLTTNGSGTLSFTDASGGASEINDLSDGYSDGYSVGLGSGALANDDGTTNFNVAVGFQAGYNVTTGAQNIALGYQAGYNVTSSQHNIFQGYRAGYNVTTGYNNIAIGQNAIGLGVTTGDNNIALGYYTGYKLTTGQHNVFQGYITAGNVTTGSSNIAIGNQTLGIGITTGSHNIALGYAAGYDLTSGQYNIFQGYRAGYNVTTGGNNIAIGNETLGLGITTGFHNIALGYQAGYDLTSGGYNVFQGYQAGTNVTTGSDNTIVGPSAGDALTTGTNNIIIGHDAAASAVDVSNEITLGDSFITSFRIPGLSLTANTTGIWSNSNEIWHAGNDGAGSGLDADTLDGIQASSFLQSNQTITLSGDVSGSGTTSISVTVADDSHTHDGRYYTEAEADARFTSIDHFRHTGTGNYTSTTTADLLTEALGDDAFDSYLTAHKTGWSYAGNGDLTDAGRLTELAGTSWLWWTDNSTDNTQGNITALCIAPNTGGSAGKMFVYNNQGSTYQPGWREIWTSTSDGAGSGLDADLLDGQHGSYYTSYTDTAVATSLPLAGGTMTGTIAAFESTGIDDNASSTAVTINSSGNVGIGTSAPTHMLTVGEDNSGNPGQISLGRGGLEDANIFFTRLGNNDAEITYSSDEDLYIKNNFAAGDVVYSTNLGAHIFKYGSAGASEAMRIDSSGNVGIGTSSPSRLLEVRGAAAKIRITDSDTSGTTGIEFVDSASVVDAEIEVGNSTQYFAIKTAATERMRIDSSGNVGIGTSSPTNPLHVVGEGTFTRGLELGINGVDATSYVSQYRSTVETIMGPLTTRMLFGTVSNHDIAIQTNNTEYMRITSSGNVGIGTSLPSEKVQISAAASSALLLGYSDGDGVGYRIRSNVSTTVDGGFNIEYNDGTDLYRVDHDGGSGFHAWYMGGSERMRIDSSGNVGIGTNSPQSGLHIYGLGQNTANITDAGNQGALLRVSDSTSTVGSGGGVIFGNFQADDTGAVGFAGIKGYLTNGNDNTIGDLTFSTRNGTTDTALTERMRINSSGNVGIGTSSPTSAYRLQTAGSNPGIAIQNTGSGGGWIDFLNSSGTVRGNIYYDNTSGYMVFGTSPSGAFSERMRINSSGNVGIGTATPRAKLHTYYGTADDTFTNLISTFRPNIVLEDLSTSAVDFQFFVDGNALQFRYGDASTDTKLTSEAMRIDSSGNVGIGTTSPSYKLDVNGNVSATNYYVDASNYITSSTSAIRIQTASGYVDIGPNNTSYSHFYTDRAKYYFNKLTVHDGGISGYQADDYAYFAKYYDFSNTTYYIKPYATDESAIYTRVEDTVGDTSTYGWVLDYNGTGSDTLTADRSHIGSYIDMDITATGGDTSNEYRAYGQYIDVYNTGDPDLLYGIHNYVHTGHTSGTVSELRANYNYALVQNTGTTTNAYGSINMAYVNFTGTQSVSNIYGTRSFAYHGASLTGTTTNAYGAQNEVEINSGTITNAYGTWSHIDYNGGTMTNNYLYYGSYAGDPGSKWGVYITGEDYNYFSGNVRAPLFYDSDNTGYYIDPAGTANMNTIQCGYAHGQPNAIGCSNWFRSSGSTGWYNGTYGGGIHMIDTTWVRVYNSKAFYVANEIAATGDITAYYSDERLKTKLGNIENSLDIIKSLNGFRYVNNDLAKENGYIDEKVQLGLSAQEVEVVLPEIVSLAPFDYHTDEETGEITSKSGENYKTVDYSKLVPVLIEAMKEQQKQIEDLRNEIDTLKGVN